MTKKILLLVLFLPMIIMISLFTTTDAVSLAISIPVTGIEIVEDNIVYLDLDQLETYKVDYTVYPTNASNAEVALSTEKVGDNRLAEVEFKEGYLIPKSIGMAKVYLSTIDGGFKDSFIIQVDSNMLQEIECEIDKDELYVGDTAYISTTFIPANAKNQVLTYTSSNDNVVNVSNNGTVKAVGRGEALITIASIDDETVKDEILVNVYNTDIMDISETEVITWDKEGQINLSIASDVEYELKTEILDNAGNVTTTDNITVSLSEQDENGNVKLSYELKEGFVGTYKVKVTILTALGYSLSKEFEVKKVDKISVAFNYTDTPTFAQGSTSPMNFSLTPYNAKGVRYEVSTSNKNVTVTELNGSFILFAQLPGVTKVTVKAYVEGIDEPATASVDVVVMPKAFNVNELGKTYGIEGVWTVAKSNADGSDTINKLSLSYGKEVGEGFLENVKWVAVDAEGKEIGDVSINSDGEFKILSNSFVGDVCFKAVYSFGTAKKESDPVKVECIGNAVTVTCYEELLVATKAEKAIVLANDVTDFGYKKDGTPMGTEIKNKDGKVLTVVLDQSYYREMKTTYDWTYYKNIGKEHPTVKVLIDFKNNVYGNGYVINAHNVTYGLDESDSLLSNALFQGPLNFVGVTDSNAAAISVKAQDNIVFGLHENVNIKNVELRGCDLQADGKGQLDLTDLDYIGTVAEILGDNVNISYSRITNGRMCLRIFGDELDSNKVINVNINNSVMSSAREFIIRMGSNAFIDGGLDPDNCSPYLPNNDVNTFPVQPNYYKMNSNQKQTYESKYIKTFVNVKNSVFKTCGFFSVGIDSHFSGGLLADGQSKKVLGGRFAEILGPGWKELAKTSYGAKLTLDGDVRIYDWKMLDTVDSSTLIEIIGNNDLFNRMKFDLKVLVREVAKKPSFGHILYTDPNYYNNAEFVHGGVALFGGGKNYGIVEEKNLEDSFAQLNGYQIGFGDAGVSYLTAAAGQNDFYFLMHDSTNVTFTPKHQDEILASDSAYENIYKQ